MSTITFTRGLPASGKSTWAKARVEQSKGQIVRVNMDDIRNMLNLPFSKEAEELALQIQDQAILSAVAAGKDVIVDNTHVEKKMPNRIKKLFDGEVTFKIAHFTGTPMEECILRDSKREGKAKVGEDVIRKMAGRLRKVVLTEEELNDTVLSPKLEYIKGLPSCVVFDIDGTLAEHVARSPYDYSRVSTDRVFQEIAELTWVYRDLGYYVMIMSGRPGSSQIHSDTYEWLLGNRVWFDDLHMRGEGLPDPLADKRNDADVKQEMVDKHIRGQFNVHIWYDDRDRVVRRLRKLGIKVVQVAPGNF